MATITQTNTAEPVISISNLVKTFGSQPVLQGINLDVHRGETMVIMGGSGCGKSTLLRHMTGTLKPDRGSIKLFGQEITIMDENELDKIRLRFGILFQSGALFNSLTVGENVALPLREHTKLDNTTIEIIIKICISSVSA